MTIQDIIKKKLVDQGLKVQTIDARGSIVPTKDATDKDKQDIANALKSIDLTPPEYKTVNEIFTELQAVKDKDVLDEFKRRIAGEIYSRKATILGVSPNK